MTIERPFIAKAFFLFLLVSVIYACYLIFRPFLVEILAATILVSIFYVPYEWMARRLGNRRRLAALVMCLLIALLVIVPLVNFIIYSAQRSVAAYENILVYINEGRADSVINAPFLRETYEYLFQNESIQGVIVDIAKKVNNWFVSGAASVIKGTTSFIISLLLIFFTMFFFFIDGEKMLKKLMHWTPLPNKYDQEIFKKFRAVSYSTMASTFITAIAQGLIGAAAFVAVGLPAFFPGVAMAFLSLLPYVGAGFVWLPAGVYLLATGKIWQGIFMLAWGAVIVSSVDNLIRAYLIKGKAQVHPIFIIFSILGGISLFGFWGIIFGPLIISLAVTILHIYELEYGKVLDESK